MYICIYKYIHKFIATVAALCAFLVCMNINIFMHTYM